MFTFKPDPGVVLVGRVAHHVAVVAEGRHWLYDWKSIITIKTDKGVKRSFDVLSLNTATRKYRIATIGESLALYKVAR